ncbi:MAG: sensor histidine kinase [Xanthomonadales bacterium]|nr:sensor histidine kinase [Xanthomonadales bacterium]
MANPRINSIALLRYAGLFTWACVGLPLVVDADQQIGRGHYWAWLAAYLAFGLAYWLVSHEINRRKPKFLRLLLLTVMALTPAAISHFSQTGLSGVLLLVSAGVLPWLLPVLPGVAWLVAQSLLLVPIFAIREDYTVLLAFLQVALFFGYSSFTFVTSLVAKRQSEARDELRRLNSELRATRVLLAESSRANERVRISRELHDLMGHHLTALSLNLEVARHQTQGDAQAHVRQAQSLARLLLADVRQVVSTLRQDVAVDLGQALARLVEGFPGVKVQLALPDDVVVEDTERAQVLLRVAQEAITNAVRHGKAANIWIQFARQADGGIVVQAFDDGIGCAQAKAGNGLTGMAERLARFGGTLSFTSARGEGFRLRAVLPTEEPS